MSPGGAPAPVPCIVSGQTLLINGKVNVSNNCAVTRLGKFVATLDIKSQSNSAIRGGVDLISGPRLYLYNCSQIETYGNVLLAELFLMPTLPGSLRPGT